MDQDLNDHDFYGSVDNVCVPLKSTTNEEKIPTNATNAIMPLIRQAI